MERDWNGRGRLAVLGCVIASSALVGCSRKDISERPPEGGGAPIFATAPSLIGAAVAVPLTQVVEIVNAEVPANHSARGNGENVCGRVLGVRICVGTRYSYTVTRGTIAIKAHSADAIKISVPVSLRGQGGFRGDGARALSLDAKNFQADAVLDIALAPKLNADWCPRLDVSASYRWTTNPRVEIVSRAWIDVRGPVERALNGQLPGLVKKAKAAIDCSRFKADVAKLYGTRTFPIALPWNDKLYVNVQPSDIAFSGLKVDQTSLRVAGVLTVKAEVSGTAIKSSPLPLPPLKNFESAEAPRLTVALPLRAPYSSLTAAVSQAVSGETFQQETPAGRVAATIGEVRIYPSADKLVVGVGFEAKLPGKILDTKGTVFVVGKPTVEEGTRVALKDVSFTRILDSDVWNGLSVLFDSQIRKAIEEAARYDLSGDIEKAKTVLAGKLADPHTIPGLKLTASNVQISLGRTAVAANELAIEALFAATVNITPDPSAAARTTTR